MPGGDRASHKMKKFHEQGDSHESGNDVLKVYLLSNVDDVRAKHKLFAVMPGLIGHLL